MGSASMQCIMLASDIAGSACTLLLTSACSALVVLVHMHLQTVKTASADIHLALSDMLEDICSPGESLEKSSLPPA